MIGLISPKNEYIYTAKWINNKNRKKIGYFRFKIIKDDNLHEQDFNNMAGDSGTATWETKSLLPFELDDIVVFRGSEFRIKSTDGDRKNTDNGEQAFIWFNQNGNIPITLVVRK